jgi:hypothetical protein
VLATGLAPSFAPWSLHFCVYTSKHVYVFFISFPCVDVAVTSDARGE